ncbi:MAG: GNAT family N-acetyltransferase [Patescibacteria group bacterium]|jgi:RimJ/RimL family protein N-acetyltransferase
MDKNEIRDNVTLRLATEKDCKKIFYLFNDPLVRKNSVNQEKLDFKNHKAWFARKICDKNYIFLIAETKGLFAGQVRFDLKGDEALTGVSLHKRFRGYGLGKILLIRGMDYLKKYRPEISFATGDIKPNNLAAVRNSEYAGFVFEKESVISGEKFLRCKCDLRKRSR